MEGACPNFPPPVFPKDEAVFPEAGPQTVLLGSRRRGIKKATVALATATVASMFAAGWGTTAQAQEIADAKGAPVVTAQQAKVAGEVAEEIARREQDPANDSWIGKALASILEGDVVPFVTLADAMLAGVGGEDLAQASGDEGSKTAAENPLSGGPKEEQDDPMAQGVEEERPEADGNPPELTNPGDAAEDAVEESEQSPPDTDSSTAGGAEKPTAEQDSEPEPESDEADAPPDGTSAGAAARTYPASSSGSGWEDDSSDSGQTNTYSSVSFLSPSPVEGAERENDARPDDSGDAPTRSGQITNASSSEVSGGGYEDDASDSVRGNVAPVYEEGPFGFAPAEEDEPPEGTSNAEIGASDESREAVEDYLESGEKEYLEDSLEQDVEDKTNPAEPGVPDGEGNYSVESHGGSDVGQEALGKDSGFGGVEESEEVPAESTTAFEDASSEEAPGAESELPDEGFEAADSPEEEQSSRSGVPEALREFLEAVEQSQAAEESSEVEREDQETASNHGIPTDVPQGAAPAAAQPDGEDPGGEINRTPAAGDGIERNAPTYAPVLDQEQPEKEEPQGAPAVEQREEVPEQDRQQPVEWERASDRAQAIQSQQQAQPQEQQSSRPREEDTSYAAPHGARHLEEPRQHGSGTGLETDVTRSLDQSIPVSGVGPDRDEPSDPGDVLGQHSSASSPSQVGPSTVDSDRVEKGPPDDAASSTPGQLTVDGVEHSVGMSGPQDAGAARQFDGFDSGDGGRPSWRAAGEDLPSTPVRPAPEGAHAPSLEPEGRNSVADGAGQAGDGGESNERRADKG
jgi:hypothetical protein